MRLAILSDIHGNLVALEAVLRDLEAEQVDQAICLGDVAAFGPQPGLVLERLRHLTSLSVLGNTDETLLNLPLDEPNDERERRLIETYVWCARQLSQADWEYLRSFRPTLEISLGDETHLLCFTDLLSPTRIRFGPPHLKRNWPACWPAFVLRCSPGGTHTSPCCGDSKAAP